MPNVAIASEAEWLAIREANIGGSEVAGLFFNWQLADGSRAVLHAYEPAPEGALCLGSCSPYTDAYKLFLAKAGRVMPADFNPSERMQAGTYLEPALAEWARAKWSMKLRKVRRYSTHPEIAGWGASLDYEVHGPGMDPVEFKNLDFIVARDQWVIEGGEVISAPLHIQLQVQHYLGARGAERGWIIACVGGNELVRGEFKRHDPTIERIGEAIAAFWANVAAGNPPVEVATFDAVAEEFAFGSTGIVSDLRGDEEAAFLARRYMRLKEHAEFTEAQMDRVKAKLAIKIADGTKAIGDGFKVTWPTITRPAKEIPARWQEERTYRGGFTVRGA